MSTYPFKVCVEKLRVRANAGVDAWGRGKAQPTLISLDISLKKYPEQAANTDSVDQSTIHYGEISKSLASAVSSAKVEWLSTEGLIALVYRTAVPSLADLIGEAQISVIYPKASKYGDGVRVTTAMPDSTTVLHLMDLRIATLIGVNRHERGAKQPLLINMWIGPFKLSCADRHQELEERLVEVRYSLTPDCALS